MNLKMNGGYDSNSVSVVGKQSNPACYNFTILNVNLIFRFSFLYQLLYQRLSRTAARISQRTAARRGLLRPELAHVRPRDRGLLPPATLPLFRSVSAAPTVVLAPQRVCLPLLLCALKQPHRRSAPVVRRRSSYRSRGASIFLRRSQALPWRRPTSRSHGAPICR